MIKRTAIVITAKNHDFASAEKTIRDYVVRPPVFYTV